MTGRSLMPRDRAEWTVDDWAALPDDGPRYELIDGTVLISPVPMPDHELLVAGVSRVLSESDTGYEVLRGAVWQPDRQTSIIPDVMVTARGDGERTARPVLAVEVMSPKMITKDTVHKRSKYEDEGVPHFWLVDPDGPTVRAYTLVDGAYRLVASASGDDELVLERPFAVRIVPSALR